VTSGKKPSFRWTKSSKKIKKEFKEVLSIMINQNKQRKYIKRHYGYIDLNSELKNIMKWLQTKPEYFSQYNKLIKLKYMIISSAILFLISFFAFIYSLILQPIPFAIIMGIIVLGLLISLIILIKMNTGILRQLFTEYCLENPEIELIEDRWIYHKKYWSKIVFIVSFCIYSVVYGAVLFIFVGTFFEDVIFSLSISTFGLFFGLIIGILFGTLTWYKSLVPLFFTATIISPFSLFSIFYMAFEPINLLVLIPFVLILLGCYFLNKFIYRLIERTILARIANDLKIYFKEYEKIYLPQWKWMNVESHLPLLIKTIDQFTLNLIPNIEYLVKCN